MTCAPSAPAAPAAVGPTALEAQGVGDLAAYNALLLTTTGGLPPAAVPGRSAGPRRPYLEGGLSFGGDRPRSAWGSRRSSYGGHTLLGAGMAFGL